LFAVSLGGMVAMEWCAAHPDDFSTLVLANTSGGNLNPPWKRMQPHIVPHIAMALASRSAVARETRILSLTTHVRAADGLPAQWASFHAERPMKRLNVLRQLAAATRFRVPPALAPRTLVISSAGDEFTHPDC